MKVGFLRATSAVALALVILGGPMAASAVTLDGPAGVTAATAAATVVPDIDRAADDRGQAATRIAALERQNRELRAALARERKASRGLRARVSDLVSQVRSLRSQVVALIATVQELRYQASITYGPWQASVASTYGLGDGLLGSGLAGGGRLDSERPVFAHKTMPFGTKVEFVRNGRRLVGECQDRGPFIAGREFDLGPRLARELNFGGVGTVKWRVIRRK